MVIIYKISPFYLFTFCRAGNAKHPAPAGQGKERVFLCPATGPAGSLSDKIFPHGGEDVQQDAGLGADAAVLHAVLLQDGIPCPHSVGHAVHREIERTDTT